MSRRAHALLLLVALLALGLRLFRLDAVPPGFYMDESSVGANAWSVLRTGHDLHGTRAPLLFEALEDWKHPLIVYGAVASEAAFGPTRFAVRLPAAVFGALTVWLLGLLAYELSLEASVALTASFVLALTPWHIQYSRMAWEAVTLGFTFVLAFWLYLVARRRSSTPLVIVAGMAFGLALYSYTPAKLVVPVYLLVIIAFEIREGRAIRFIADRVRRQASLAPRGPIQLEPDEPPVPREALTTRQVQLLALAFLLVAAPMVVVQAMHFESIQTRFRAVSVFREASPAAAAAASYFAHLDPRFLFVTGDANPRHGWHGWGELLLATAPLVAFGLWRLVRRREPQDGLVLAWVLVYPLGACLTSDGVPHASRAFLAVPLFALLAAHGLGWLVDNAGSKHAREVVVFVALFAVSANAGLALSSYATRYPFESAAAWNEGAEPLLRSLEQRRGKLAKVWIAPDAGLLRDDVLFLGGFDPAKLDPAKPDPYYEWVPRTRSLARLLTSMKKDEVLVDRLGQAYQLGVPPAETFLDRTGKGGFAVYRGLGK